MAAGDRCTRLSQIARFLRSPLRMTKKRGKKAQKNMASSPPTSSPVTTTNKDSPIDLYAYNDPHRPSAP